MDDKGKADVFRTLQRAAGAYAAALLQAGCQLDSTALMRRCDDVIAESEVFRADAEHYARAAKPSAKVIPFRRPAPRVQSAVEEADWLGLP